MSKEAAVFAYRKDEIPSGGLLPDKQSLFGKLHERGVTPLVSRGAESAFTADGIEAGELSGETVVKNVGMVAIETVGVIVNRLDRSVKKSELEPAVVENLPALINENELRSLVFRKARVQDEVLSDLGLGMPTRLLESPNDIAAFVGQTPAELYMVKPNSGTFSRGIKKLDAKSVHDYVQSEEGYGKTIIQPAYDFSEALPASIRPYDSKSRDSFEAYNRAGVTKELRVYGFTSPSGTDVFPVARSMDGSDHWFFVDPESVPESLLADTKTVFGKAAELTGSKAIYGALDIGFGAKGSEAPDYHVIEFNGRMPYLIGADKHPEVASQLRNLFANQIRTTIEDANA